MMTALYFIGVYGWMAGMIAIAIASEPRKSTGNSGVRL